MDPRILIKDTLRVETNMSETQAEEVAEAIYLALLDNFGDLDFNL